MSFWEGRVHLGQREQMRTDEFKDTGVKRLFLAAVVPKTREKNHNQRQLIEALGMEGLEWGCQTFRM